MTDMYWLRRSVPQGEPGGGGLLDEYAPVSRPIASGLNAITPLLFSRQNGSISVSRQRFRRLYGFCMHAYLGPP